ncbi:hypothetical protein CAPTEDRAFT_139551 [Capitella teleta]|uniref:PX domain-containing protein n=1 Tax=Capitella teleta TaxID=283909 RepID=R7TK15_CAPTE|nr:hypothetical protein CAPTEDRAFT_139551 [Capitella teleta]|eukprot:ELT94064.1 hypothetical protein CAPTEDRAFT_139551 [Capitella teleta]
MVRCFEVTDPTLHSKGHTIYKVTQKFTLFHMNSFQFVVWRRYNDFKKLHKAMHSLHMALQRKEEFPPFVGAKVFGRFDSGVLTQRMQSGQDLLNFIGQRHYLVANKAFQVFFQVK